MASLYRIVKQSVVLTVAALLLFFSIGLPAAQALSPELRKLFNSGIYYYDPGASTTCAVSGGGGLAASGGTYSGADDYTIDQVRAFVHQPINSSWNIPDSVAEQWFLQRGSVKNTEVYNGLVKGVIPRYGLDSNNIGEITAVVKAAGVSPVLFYAYTVTEGGGLGGFINHFGVDEELDGGVANAKRDAEYLVKVANSKEYGLAWKDEGTTAGNGDFVPKDIQNAGNADFQNMPLGTIGRALIPSTAAVVWEFYYPDGLKGSVNGVQDYGAPIQAIMKTIKTIGGDPLDGGAIISSDSDGCTRDVAGEGITKAVNFAVMIAGNDGYGYDQATRESGYTKWQSDPDCISECANFDCSSLVSAALTEAGYFGTNPNFTTSSMENALEQAGFTRVDVSSFDTSKDLVRGDILVAPGSHTEIYIGDNQTVGAHIDENNNASGGKVGDQNGKEISVITYVNHPWESAWRAPN